MSKKIVTFFGAKDEPLLRKGGEDHVGQVLKVFTAVLNYASSDAREGRRLSTLFHNVAFRPDF